MGLIMLLEAGSLGCFMGVFAGSTAWLLLPGIFFLLVIIYYGLCANKMEGVNDSPYARITVPTVALGFLFPLAVLAHQNPLSAPGAMVTWCFTITMGLCGIVFLILFFRCLRLKWGYGLIDVLTC